MRLAPAPPSSEHETHRARDTGFELLQNGRCSQQHGRMSIMTTGVHTIVIARFEVVNALCALENGQGIHVGPQQDARCMTRADIGHQTKPTRTSMYGWIQVLGPSFGIGENVHLLQQRFNNQAGRFFLIHEFGMLMQCPTSTNQKIRLILGSCSNFLQQGLRLW